MLTLHLSLSDQVRADERVTYFAFGDSITFGSGDAAGHTYPQAIALAKGLTLKNYAESGDAIDSYSVYFFRHVLPGPAANPLVTGLIGTNDADRHAAGSAYETRIFRPGVLATLAWAAIPSTDKVYGASHGCTQSGWSLENPNYASFYNIDRAFSYGINTGSAGARVTCAIRVSAAGVLYAWVRGGSAGTYSYSVDGGAPVAAAIAGPPNGYFMVADLIRIRGLSPGRHTFTLIAGSASLGFAGVGTVPPQTDLGCCRIVQGGVPYQKYDAATPTAAMSVAGTNLLTFAAAPRIIAPPAETERTMIEDLTDPRAIAAGTFATNATATTLGLSARLARTVNADDVIGIARHGDTAAFNADVQGAVATLRGDGLTDIAFADVRRYVNPTSDMANQLHPSQIGVAHLTRAFLAVLP
jgi:hypothetical protein